MPASTYRQVLEILQETEAQVVGERAHKNRWLSALQRVIWLPTKFVALGVKRKLKALISWAFLTTGFLLIERFLLSSVTSVDPNFRTALEWVCILCPAVLVMFPMPSIYVASGVALEDADFAMELIWQRGLDSKGKVAAALQILKMFEERCKRRVLSLTWLVGLAWAGCTYFFVKDLEAGLAGHPPAFVGLMIYSLCSFAVMTFYLAVTGYESALDRVFRSIDVACTEVTLQIELAEEAQAHD